MSLISSDTLFHFTGSRDSLIGILTNEFKVGLSVESFAHIQQYRPEDEVAAEAAFPMVCFCDIPLSQVGSHMKHYGQYGLGLTKDWGVLKGITPVLYTHRNSAGPRTVARLIDLLDRLDMKSKSEETKRLALSVGELAYFQKPYEGRLIRGQEEIQSVRFYDEREWRFVPQNVEEFPALTRDELKDSVLGGEVREMVRRLPPVSFDPSDINFVIVATEGEVLPMFHEIQRIKKKYGQDERDTLCTKIISAERISRDF